MRQKNQSPKKDHKSSEVFFSLVYRNLVLRNRCQRSQFLHVCRRFRDNTLFYTSCPIFLISPKGICIPCIYYVHTILYAIYIQYMSVLAYSVRLAFTVHLAFSEEKKEKNYKRGYYLHNIISAHMKKLPIPRVFWY